MLRTLATLLLLAPVSALAASPFGLTGTAQGMGENAFDVTLSPLYPSPHSSVRLSFLSSSLDLTNATIDASVNKKSIYSGSVAPVTIPLGEAGVPVTVSLTLTTNGTHYTQTTVVVPEDVSLIAEPVASVPPLYPGKPRVPLEGSVRVVAIAGFKDRGGKEFDPATLSYAWTVDGTTIANGSGIGHTSLLVASPLQYRTREVSVVVTTQDGSLIGGDSLSLTGEEPTIRLYEQDALLGLRFDRALTDSYTLTATEATLYAAPFSFPLVKGPPQIQWTLNGEAAQTGSTITMRPSGTGQGTASLSVTASGGDTLSVSDSLSVSFGSPRPNLFGL